MAVIPVLVHLLADTESSVDEAASDALWHIGRPAVLQLIQALRDRSAPVGVRLWAARTFMHIDDPRSIQPMLDIIRDPSDDTELRHVVTTYVSQMKTDRAYEGLLQIATDSSAESELRLYAVIGLGRLGNARAVEPLRALVQQADFRIRNSFMMRELERIEEIRRHAASAAASHLSDLAQHLEQGKSFHEVIRQVLKTLSPAHTPET